VFDEIHKYRGCRNWLKGVYDGRETGQRILVTGSARLDFYHYSGDSLQGRYHLHRLHPLSVAELGGRASRSPTYCAWADSLSRSSLVRRWRPGAGPASTGTSSFVKS
jgi:predicted AAA+ superfamily ATPase